MSETNKDQSPEIAALAEALAKAQAEIDDARTSAWNPHFRKRYADLSDVWIACRAALTKHGLSVVQLPRTNDKVVTVRTVLMHSSGQWIAGELSAPADKWTPQGIGGAVTYLRRFGLASAVGIAPRGDDDDGEGDEPGERGNEPRPRRDPEPDRRPPSDRPSDSGPRPSSAGDRAAEAQTGVPQHRGQPGFDPAHVALCDQLEAEARAIQGDPADLYDRAAAAKLPIPLARRAFFAVLCAAARNAPDLDVLGGWEDLAHKISAESFKWEGLGEALKDAFDGADERLRGKAA